MEPPDPSRLNLTADVQTSQLCLAGSAAAPSRARHAGNEPLIHVSQNGIILLPDYRRCQGLSSAEWRLPRLMHTPAYAAFTRRLVEARKAAGLTQAEVAARLQRPQSFVAKYEGGERRLDVIEFLAIAQALDVEPGSFIAKLHQAVGVI